MTLTLCRVVLENSPREKMRKMFCNNDDEFLALLDVGIVWFCFGVLYVTWCDAIFSRKHGSRRWGPLHTPYISFLYARVIFFNWTSHGNAPSCWNLAFDILWHQVLCSNAESSRIPTHFAQSWCDTSGLRRKPAGSYECCKTWSFAARVGTSRIGRQKSGFVSCPCWTWQVHRWQKKKH